METYVNRLTLKALLMSVIMEIKHGRGLPNALGFKKKYKELAGVPKNCSNRDLLYYHLQLTYQENGLEQEFKETLEKFKMT